MLEINIKFTWERPERGESFTWQEAGKGGPRLLRPPGVPLESYEPLAECTGLFRTFADVAPTEAGILKFANRFGVLCGPALPWQDLIGWQDQIGRMKALVGVWDQLVQEDWPGLCSARGTVPRTLLPPQSAEIIQWAVQLLWHNVLPLALGWTVALFGQEPSPPVIWNSQGRRPVLTLAPPSLLHALYLQFAQAIAANKRFQLCEACGKWFELSPGLNRADRQSCSDYCRLKLYRLRKQRARQLHVQKWSLKRISAELGSDIPTIKRWLSTNKE
jgi:hypothetical protein